ncbi:MAG: preprotein translocase subunit SecG [Calditrichae bacterium]|nr:preprotein translocase subunit SecG [Calditrichia bacterium]
MYTVLVTLFVFICIVMIVTILMQASKGGGLASSFGGMGGAGGVLGSRGAASFLQKATVVLALIYGLLCLAIGLMGRPGEGTQESVIQEQLNQQQQQQAPANLPAVEPFPEQGQPGGQGGQDEAESENQ